MHTNVTAAAAAAAVAAAMTALMMATTASPYPTVTVTSTWNGQTAMMGTCWTERQQWEAATPIHTAGVLGCRPVKMVMMRASPVSSLHAWIDHFRAVASG